MQCVGASHALSAVHLKLDDTDRSGRVGARRCAREARLRNRHRHDPRNESGDEPSAVQRLQRHFAGVGSDARLEYRPLAARNDTVGDVFRVQGALLRYFREFLTERGFTEIITSKIVASGTEGGTNLFSIDYFDRVAYLAQSPQFYKEHGVAAFERVFETGHVYRAEPHASSRHLTEYYSLDLEFGFIDAAEDVIQMEKELLTSMFEQAEPRARGNAASTRRDAAAVDAECADVGVRRVSRPAGGAHGTHASDRRPRSGSRAASVCAGRSRVRHSRGIRGRLPVVGPAVLFGAAGRRAAPRRASTCCSAVSKSRPAGSACIDARDLEAALRARQIEPAAFESHLRMFELGMPPHGGLAIGLERLTAQVMGLPNVREAVLYPRDRDRLTP